MNIAIEFLHAEELRYPTQGDYFYRGGNLVFQIAKSGNDVYDRLVLIHEMIEQLLVEHKGISNEAIDDFDMAHLDSRDPGDEPDSPYRDEHNIATAVERLLTAYMGVSWQEYDQAVLGETE